MYNSYNHITETISTSLPNLPNPPLSHHCRDELIALCRGRTTFLYTSLFLNGMGLWVAVESLLGLPSRSVLGLSSYLVSQV